MSFTRSLSINRISGQMAILVLVSLLLIHAVITAGIFLSSRWNEWSPKYPSADQFNSTVRLVSLVSLIAATPSGDRERLIADITRAFPQVDIKPGGRLPEQEKLPGPDPQFRHLQYLLGPAFHVAAPSAAEIPGEPAQPLEVAIQIPDGSVLIAHLPPRRMPPIVGPISITLLSLVISVALLGVWGTRALRTPLSGFAEAAQGFSLDGNIAELPERGPEEIRAVAKAFNQMRERIKALVDDRTRMLAALGHDLRTPITRLRLRSEFIADQELRAPMLRDLDQMKAMTDKLLSFLRLGLTHDRATAIDIASSLQVICDQFADIGHNVTYRGPDHVTVTAYSDDLHRAVTNLVDNAVRFGSKSEVRLIEGPHSIFIEVQDDGPGILDINKELMQQPFVRGDAARGIDDTNGFGLGLSLSRATAEAHGGKLELLDGNPTGLIARITLPL